MSRDKKNVKLEENKKLTINKKYIFIIVGIILILLIVIGIVIFLNKEDKPSNLTKENEIVEEDNTPVFEERTIEEQKNILLDILNNEIAKYEEMCSEENNNECITSEEKEEILNNFNSFKERLENEEISQEEIEQLKQEINDYLVTLDPEVKLDDLISEETKDKGNTTTKEEEKNKESTTSNVASGIEGVLNSAKLNPIKTGYTSLDNQVASVLSSVTNNSMSTYEKVKAVYDWVINNMSYQIGFIIGEEISNLVNNYGFYEKDATQIFLAENGFGTHKGSCDNYSAMFMILTRRIGLDSYVVSARNKDGSGHTTVNIKINGKWYNFDPQREDNSLKNGKIMYYAFGEDDNDSKPYTYVNRNSDVAAFHAFAKQPESNYLKATITIGGKSYNLKTAIDSYTYTAPDMIEINYAEGPNIIKVEANEKVKYAKTSHSYPTANFVWNIEGTIDKTGEIIINQTVSYIKYEIIHLEDDLGRELNLIVKVNYRDPNKEFSIDYQGGDISYTDYVYLSVAKRDAVGDVKFSYKVIETNDPKGADAIIFTEEKYSTYTVKVSNLDRSQYYYVVEITGIDEAGNKATDIANITVKS